MPATISAVSVHHIMGDFPDISFQPADTFYWSARSQTVYYCKSQIKKPTGIWQLLHEIGHATSQHSSFHTSIELIRMESQAWQAAQQLAESYHIVIDEDHIERCLDSYRDWLYLRSTCPNCKAISVENAACQYRCFNCAKTWQVSPDQRSRCYRRRLDPSS